MASSSAPSSLTRYRPIVLTIFGFAVGYSIYYVYTSSTQSKPSGLHRSNAVHRRRRAATNTPENGAVTSRSRDNPANDNSVETADIPDGTETVAETEAIQTNSQDGSGLKALLYYIAEDQSRQNAYIHRGVMCNSCFMKPIRGIRWRCANCADYDLCSDCEASNMHPKTHIFYKVKIPAPFLGNPRQTQAVVYPGKPAKMPRSLPTNLFRRFVDETKFEKEEIEALYDQFTCLANANWTSDPNGINYAIDRTAFDTAFIPLTSINAPQPNLLYDRIFSFYDSNGDGLIGFEELLKGLAHIQDKNHDQAARRRHIFNGFDVDSDGYISRKDVLRLFRAYYAIQKDITHDLLAVQDEEYEIKNVQQFIFSGQPLSAAFTESAPGVQTTFPTDTKQPNSFGDTRDSTNPIHVDSTDEGPRDEIVSLLPGEELWNRQQQNPPGTFIFPASRPLIDEPWMSAEEDAQVTARLQASAMRDRFRRREFYTDEEEGFLLEDPDKYSSSRQSSNQHQQAPTQHTEHAQRTPLGFLRSAPSWNVAENPAIGIEATPAPSAARKSREQVLHRDGYEVPIPDAEIGKEILYQVVQQGLNELLDPLFKEKEDLALLVEETAMERRRWKREIRQFVKAQKREKAEEKREEDENKLKNGNGSAFHSQQSADANVLEDEETDISSSVSSADHTESEDEGNVEPMGWNKHPGGTKWKEDSRPKGRDDTDLVLTSVATDRQVRLDPTMPQFRPNSDKDVDQHSEYVRLKSIHAWEENRIPTQEGPNGSVNGGPIRSGLSAANIAKIEPTKAELKQYAMLNEAERSIKEQGGKGRLSFQEFKALMHGEEGRRLAFVDQWFELGSF
ncbi:EF-hand [Microthyrium microscopicum]|uniref:EF-hand n=1 Tax=Microthyrium microscopicum TaxID=703497 RepID=A0A6A6U4S2_9PEZI|nr:EF-hand [Microthyrium microscopicum]